MSVAAIFLGNAVGYFVSFLFVAEVFRQTRCITPTDAIKRRYGRVNEQFFTWAQVPIGVIQAGIWLNGLAIFTSAVFGISIEMTIVITGVIVMFVSLSGGSWAVVASDYIQMLVIMAISITATLIVATEVGVVQVVTDFPRDLFTNNLSYGALFFVWFLPPMATAVMGIDLAAEYPTLGGKAADASYLAFVDNVMPIGMVGIMIAALFSATMSSMDSGLNRSAGIMVLNFYNPILKKGNATNNELMRMSKILTFCFGVVIVLVGLFISSLKELSLFDIMLQTGSLIQMPILIPLTLAIIIKKVPDWAPWARCLLDSVFL